MANPILNAKSMAKITGIAVAAVALLGIVLSLMGTDGMYGLFCTEPTATTCTGTASESSFLAFDWIHNIVHVALAAIALWIGFGKAPYNTAKMYGQVFGAVYLALGIAGFIVADLAILHLELGENLIHIVIGLYGLAAGFLGTPTTGTPTATPTMGTAPAMRR